MKKIVRYLLFALAVAGASVGDSLAMKGNIGVNAYEAFALAVSNLTLIKVGTVCIMMNSFFIAVEMIMARKVEIKYLLQIVLALFQGQLINVIYYDILGGFIPQSYAVRLLVTVAGMCITGISCGLLMALDILCFPMEGFCELVSLKLGREFGKIRQGMDVVMIAAAILLCLLFSSPWTVREGTVIGLLILGPVMGISRKLFEKLLK